MDPVPLVIFAATYAGLALGRVPGLALDRTGVALLGAVACLATGKLSLAQAQVAIDGGTLALLFGMMVLSAQYRISGLYAVISERLAHVEDPRRLLLGVVVVSALLASVLTNDVVCLALTPMIGTALLRARIDPVPFLLTLACATNIGSALTPVGNPQNILVSQSLGLEFGAFVLACAPPVVLALAFLYLFMRGRVQRLDAPTGPPAELEVVVLDRFQASKAVLLTILAVGLFLSPVPGWLTALGVAGVALLNRRTTTRQVLGLVDWQMLTLFASLFVIMAALEQAGWTRAAEQEFTRSGLDLSVVWVLVPVVALISNLVSNVPAVMLLLPFLPTTAATGHLVALSSTFAGNAVLLGSIANLIVAEQALRLGVRVSFRSHLRVGLPVSLVSLGIVVAWEWLRGAL